jgi:two-component system nitrate/nitrite response regulator NarL
MEPLQAPEVSEAFPPTHVVIASEVRFLRDSLGEILRRVPGIGVCGQAGTLTQALAAARELRPGVVLLDASFPGGPRAAAELGAALPSVSLIALGVHETAADVLAWAEVGIAGYVPNTASVEDLIVLIGQIGRGEQTCPSHIAGSLFRRVGAAARAIRPAAVEGLTARELEVCRMVGAGLSNKDIARRLAISLSTTKTHVHNLLTKLRLTRRAEVMARSRGAQLDPSPP